MDLWKSLTGLYHIEITSASISDTLTAINTAGIRLSNVADEDELTIKCVMTRREYIQLKILLEKRGDVVKITKREGLFWSFFSLKNRPVLFVGLIAFLILALYLPTRVLFVRVEGNIAVPERLIVEKAEACGIRFGTSRREVRSEKMKNKLLAVVPELRWAGINTYGCVAVISVRERSTIEQETKRETVASIIARKDGIISKMTIYKGNPVCRVGQAVKAGQILVSGYTDCGLTIKAEAANAEVFALTRHNLEVITPVTYQKTVDLKGVKRNYSLQIGKKLINFAKDSGISSATCVKMYKTNYLLLPGGFRLPVALITEEWISRSFEPNSMEEGEGHALVRNYAKNYLNEHMLAGKILQSNFSFAQNDGLFRSVGNFSCSEMIGQLRSEEIFSDNGKSD